MVEAARNAQSKTVVGCTSRYWPLRVVTPTPRFCGRRQVGAVQCRAVKRRLFTILSALSLLLCVAVCVLWVRSLIVGDTFRWHFCEDEGDYTLWVQNTVKVGWGGMGFNRVVQSGNKDSFRQSVSQLERQYGPWPFYRRTAAEYPYFNFADFSGQRSVDEARFGFRWGRYDGRQIHHGGPTRGFMVVLPFLAVLMVVGPPMFLLVRRYVTLARRRRGGLCPSCGYDLRATPGRCPECGLVPAAPPTTPTSRGNVQ